MNGGRAGETTVQPVPLAAAHRTMSETPANENGLAQPAIHLQLDDEQYAALIGTVAGEKVVGLALWEESITDEVTERPGPEMRAIFDLDLYLENNLLLTLYGTSIFPDPESEPLHGWQRAGKIVQSLVSAGIWLDDIAATEENDLVLVLCRDRSPQLYLIVSGWSVEKWEQLPGEQ